MRKITVIYGSPISLEEYYDKQLEPRELQDIADGVLNTIRELGKGDKS